MIPSPVPLLPLVLIVMIATGAAAWSAYRAGTHALRHELKSRTRRTGLGVASAAAVLSLAGIGLLANITLNHERTYSALVWSHLQGDYGLVPAAEHQDFQAGMPFPAVLNGEDVSCIAVPPDLVECAGEAVPVIGGDGNDGVGGVEGEEVVSGSS